MIGHDNRKDNRLLHLGWGGLHGIFASRKPPVFARRNLIRLAEDSRIFDGAVVFGGQNAETVWPAFLARRPNVPDTNRPIPLLRPTCTK